MKIEVGHNKTIGYIDEEDYIKIKAMKSTFICNTSHGYMCVKIHTGGNSYRQEYIHRMVMNAPKGVEVDHINGNKMDNRKKNLRLCNRSENASNRKQIKGRYKGVYRDKKRKCWVAQITFNYKCTTLGVFKTAKEAALAYNIKAKELHGEYAHLNNVCV